MAHIGELPNATVHALAIVATLGTGLAAGQTPAAEVGAHGEPPAVALVTQLGHAAQPVSAAAFVGPGHQLLSVGWDGNAVVWDVATGSELGRLVALSAPGRSLAVSRDGGTAVAGDWDGGVTVWSVAAPATRRRLSGHSAMVTSVAVSPDGERILTGSIDRTAVLWDARSGRELFELRSAGLAGSVYSVVFSPDGGRALVGLGGTDAGAVLWDLGRREVLHTFRGHSDDVTAVAFTPDGQSVLTAGRDGIAIAWDAATGAEVRRFERHSEAIHSVAMAPDGKTLYTAGRDRLALAWDLDTGAEVGRAELSSACLSISPDGSLLAVCQTRSIELRRTADFSPIRRLEGRASFVNSVAVSADGRRLLTGSGDHLARIWDLDRGAQMHQLRGHAGQVVSVAFSPDGSGAVTGGYDRKARIWEVANGEERRVVEDSAWVVGVGFSRRGEVMTAAGPVTTSRSSGTGDEIRRFTGHAFAASADGRTILTGSSDHPQHHATLWSSATGEELASVRLPGFPKSVALSPDPGRAVVGLSNGTALLWDYRAGADLRPLDGHTDDVSAVAFSPDGRYVATASFDRSAAIWDVESGVEVHRLAGHSAAVNDVAFSPDGSRLITGSSDNTVRIWSTAGGALLATLISFTDGTWAVVDPEGRYDGSRAGDVDGLHWVVGMEPVALHQLKERYYEPGLLAKVMGFNEEPLRDVKAFTSVALYPAVAVPKQPSPDDPTARIVLRDRGGGIGRVVVSLNGREISADARPGRSDGAADSVVIDLDLSESPYLLRGEENRLTVQAFNADGYLASRPRGFGFEAPGESDDAQPHLWAVIAGVSDYTGDALDLRYAAKDASDMAGALRLAGERLFGAERTHIRLLTTDPGAPGALEPSRRTLESVLRTVADSAAPTDVVVVYLAGHGVVHGGVEGDYYYLTREARSPNLVDPMVRASAAFSSAQLTELLGAIRALKQVLILDTCGAGRAVETLVAARDVSSSQIRAMERMKDRTGIFVLAGSAADAVSYEASRYAQGVLTYSLLMGLKGAALREDEFVDVSALFNFAVDRVPELARDIGGIQRPQLAAPRGGQSFDIGRLTATDRERIPLAEARPLVLRANFQDERRFVDHLGLTAVVNEALRAASADGRGAGGIVFVDAESFPGAHSLVGRYSVTGGEVAVSGFLFRGEEEAGELSVSGPAQDLPSLAERIRTETERLIRGR